MASKYFPKPTDGPAPKEAPVASSMASLKYPLSLDLKSFQRMITKMLP